MRFYGCVSKITRLQIASITEVLYRISEARWPGIIYEPESLKVMIASLNQHIKESRGYNILSNKDFELSRKVLNGKAIQLQQSGKGKRPKKADALYI